MRRFQPIPFYLLLVVLATTTSTVAQNQRTSEKMASTVLTIWKDTTAVDGRADKWNYEQGVLLKGIESVWLSTGDGRYFKYIQHLTDRFINDDGSIRTYKKDDYNIDNVLPGRNLLLLYKVTGQEKYRKAAALLREQLQSHPRTSDGGFWHKKIYPSQMWLDGLYMGEPFYAEYAATFNEEVAFDDIAKQFVLMETHSRDSKTGLLYHGWDEAKQQRWANPTTGRSPNFWGRAMGWYAMALVDTLDHFPSNHPQRQKLIAILQRLAAAVETYQDQKSGLWYQVLDKAGQKGNYAEASASSMFVYALAKGVRLNYVPPRYLRVARKGYQGIQKQFIETTPTGVNLNGTVSVSGLGGNPYRDGSYEYYLSEKVVTNDPKGVGAFLLASSEMEMVPELSLGTGKTILLDSYFNNETKKDANGRLTSWHYKWDELPNAGFSLWGNIFKSLGAETKTLMEAPTAANLKKADVYIIVDPDTDKETERPNYIEKTHINSIVEWVKVGGVLVLMGNDVGNSEFDHFNQLANSFGVQFKKDSRNRVQGTNFVTGRILVPAGNGVFTTARQLFLKELSTLSVTPPAKTVIEDNGDSIIAVAKVGRGTVFAVGDPWLYNEYVDGRKLPPEYENFKAARDLSRWLILQTRSRAARK
ncbi:MAG TPA: glycoside hydrolase family 88 protein [Pyrinomonadaceae bacterium]|nr:glycoside hydrolase family 88 protein [Pyrinomonadaceae bacterium]